MQSKQNNAKLGLANQTNTSKLCNKAILPASKGRSGALLSLIHPTTLLGDTNTYEGLKHEPLKEKVTDCLQHLVKGKAIA